MDEIRPGDLFEDENDGELYLLASIGPAGYAAISLLSGNRWLELARTKQEAVKGLKWMSGDVIKRVSKKRRGDEG